MESAWLLRAVVTLQCCHTTYFEPTSRCDELFTRKHGSKTADYRYSE